MVCKGGWMPAVGTLRLCVCRMLFVHSAFQGKEVGTVPVISVIDAAQKIGYDAIQLETVTYILDACHLYRVRWVSMKSNRIMTFYMP